MVYALIGTFFSGNSLSNKTLALIYDADSTYFNAITNIKSAIAKKCIWNACDTL